MLKRKARQFFIFSLISGMIMIFSAFSVPEQISGSAPIRFITEQGGELLKSIESAIPKGIRSQASLVVNQAKKSVNMQEQVGIDDRTGAFVHEDKKYVYIEGKYYLYSPSNRYVINGKTIFFRAGQNEIAQERERRRKHREKIEQWSKNHPNSEYTPQFGVKSLSPGNMKAMMDSVKQTQLQMKARNKALEQMLKE